MIVSGKCLFEIECDLCRSLRADKCRESRSIRCQRRKEPEINSRRLGKKKGMKKKKPT